MLKQLSVENFTVFPQADFKFAAGLNVLVGENGTGKSHVLKLAYAIIHENYTRRKLRIAPNNAGNSFQLHYVEKLLNVFKVAAQGSLITKPNQANTAAKKQYPKLQKDYLRVELEFQNKSCNSSLSLSADSLQDFKFSDWKVEETTEQCHSHPAVFLPTRELLTIYPGFVSLYEKRYLEFDETYRDTALLLGEPLLKSPPVDLLEPLEQAMGGKTKLNNGRFYLVTPEQGEIEMPLVAEGLRKLAMLAQLIAVGALKKNSYLFWDEPEANLNPRLIKVVAKVILQLAKAGVQIFIATHSLFLLRELEVLQSADKQPVAQRYFALKQNNQGVEVEQGGTPEDLDTLIMLDEELLQSDRYLQTV